MAAMRAEVAVVRKSPGEGFGHLRRGGPLPRKSLPASRMPVVMFRFPGIAVLLLAASLAAAQAPLFQVLDTPLPAQVMKIDGVGDLNGDGYADLLGVTGIFLND